MVMVVEVMEVITGLGDIGGDQDAGCDHGTGGFGGNGDITVMMIVVVMLVAVMKVMG